MLIEGTKRNEEEQPMIGSSSIQPSGTSVGANPNPTQQGTRSGSFTNLKTYLDKNQANVGTTVNALQRKADAPIQQAQGILTQAEKTGQQQLGELGETIQNQEFIKSALQNPLEADVSKFSKLRQSFTPRTTGDFAETAGQATGQARQLATNLEQIGTPGGLTDFLRQTRQTPRYTQGAQTLDRFLIQGTDVGRQGIENIQNQARAISGDQRLIELQNQIAQSQGKIDPTLANAEAVQNLANTAYSGYREGLNPTRDAAIQNMRAQLGLNEGTDSALAEYQNQIGRFNQAISSSEQEMNRITNQIRSTPLMQLPKPLQEEIVNLRNQLANDPGFYNRSYSDQERILNDRETQLREGYIQNQVSPLQQNIQNSQRAIEQENAQTAGLRGLYDQFNQFQSGNITRQQALSPNDITRYNALAALAGVDPSVFLGGTI